MPAASGAAEWRTVLEAAKAAILTVCGAYRLHMLAGGSGGGAEAAVVPATITLRRGRGRKGSKEETESGKPTLKQLSCFFRYHSYF